jgi:hypothetical protein
MVHLFTYNDGLCYSRNFQNLTTSEGCKLKQTFPAQCVFILLLLYGHDILKFGRGDAESPGIKANSNEEQRMCSYKEKTQSTISSVGTMDLETGPYQWRQQLLAEYILTVDPSIWTLHVICICNLHG